MIPGITPGMDYLFFKELKKCVRKKVTDDRRTDISATLDSSVEGTPK